MQTASLQQLGLNEGRDSLPTPVPTLTQASTPIFRE